jgi:SPP1 family predicted phage head-tail adaptor
MSGFRGACGKSSSKAAKIIPIVDAGMFRQRITIQTPALVRDNRGGGVYNWSPIATVWAHIKTITASGLGDRNRKQFEEAQFRAQNHYIITIRYGDTITTAMRVLYNGLDLEIFSVVNVDVLNWIVELHCKESGNGEP